MPHSSAQCLNVLLLSRLTTCGLFGNVGQATDFFAVFFEFMKDRVAFEAECLLLC